MNCANKTQSAYRKGLYSVLVFLHPWNILQAKSTLAATEGWLNSWKERPGHLFKHIQYPWLLHSLQEGEPGCVLKSSCEVRGYAKGMCSDSPLGRGDFQILSSFALHLNRFKLLQIYVTRPNFSQGTGWTVMMKESRHSNMSFHCSFAV